jgi:hypothetical protein
VCVLDTIILFSFEIDLNRENNIEIDGRLIISIGYVCKDSYSIDQ